MAGSSDVTPATVTLPVAVYRAEPFHRAALTNARHFSSTMDTLVSLGVIVAYLYSLAQYVLNAVPPVGAGGTESVNDIR